MLFKVQLHWHPNAQCDGIRAGVHEVIRSWGWGSHEGNSYSYKGGNTEVPSLFHQVRTQQQLPSLQLGEQPFPELDHATAMTLGFQPPQLWETNACCLQSTSFCPFTRIAWDTKLLFLMGLKGWPNKYKTKILFRGRITNKGDICWVQLSTVVGMQKSHSKMVAMFI